MTMGWLSLILTVAFIGSIVLIDRWRRKRGKGDDYKPTADYFGVDARM